jgi:hypothetical protein
MQATAIIGPTQLKELLHRVFETGSPEVYEAYSEYDQALKRFTFRHELTGWGVIQLQFDFKKRPDIECHIGVNAKKRANLWSSTYPNMGAPGLWSWNVVERHAGRLIRHLRKLGRSYRASQKGSPSAGN